MKARITSHVLCHAGQCKRLYQGARMNLFIRPGPREASTPQRAKHVLSQPCDCDIFEIQELTFED